jgi:hypothetical protein
MTSEVILYRQGIAALNRARHVANLLVCEEALVVLVAQIAPRVDRATARAARFAFDRASVSAVLPNGHRFCVAINQSVPKQEPSSVINDK